MKVKTSELEWAALDCAVAIAEGFKVTLVRGAVILDGEYTEELLHIPLPNYGKRYSPVYRPSTDWSQGGPLIEQFKIGFLEPRKTENYWTAWVGGRGGHMLDGLTPLIAACRAIVAAKLGDEVDIPEELL